MLVFPRRSALPPDYSGCISHWLNDRLIARVHLVSGKVRELEFPSVDKSSERYSCTFLDGNVTGGPRCADWRPDQALELAKPRASLMLSCYVAAGPTAFRQSCPDD